MDMDLSAPWIIAPPVRVLFLPDKAGVSEALHTLERRLRLILNPISIANLAIFNQLDWGKQCAEFFAEASLEMDLPANDAELVPEKIEDGKEEGPSFKCDLSDTEIVHKIAQAFLPGLASACVDSTSGGIFKSPASVAVDMRKDLVDYLTQRSESFIAEFVILEAGPGAEVSDHPYDIVSDFVDDFASSKRNLFSRVSGWLLSEKREDKIDDFVQEMEINGFWLLDKREAIAHTLLKNVDFKNAFHCNGKFMSAEGLAEHVCHCSFRSLTCTNEGCNARFCASQLEKHDSVCPFKIVPCEQKCSGSIMRREMDRHCITVCPMKLVNCPFYALGCPSAIPYCVIEQHCSDTVHFHLLYVLQVIHKEASEEDLKRRVDQLEQAASSSWLAEAREVRSLTSKVKDLEAKLGPLEVHIKNKDSEENVEISNISNALDEAHINKDSQERMGTLNLVNASREAESPKEQGEETRMHTIHLFQQHQGDGFCRCGDGLYLRMLQKIMRTDSINFIAISKPFSLAADDDYRFMNRKSKMKDLPSQKTPVLLKRECFSSELNLTAQETIVKFSSCLFKFVVWDKKTSFSIRSNVFTIVHCSRPNYADISKDLHAD